MDERPDPNAPDQDEGIAAYHGSPHDFDQFDLSKIGTGEGAQAYGHGLYFAENENIAKSYRDALTRGAGNMVIEGRPFSEFHGSSDPEKFLKAKLAINMLHDDRDIQQAIDWQIQQTKGKLSSRRLLPEDVEPLMEDLQRLNQMKQSPPKIEKNPGHMYEVRINADPDKHFLDWDAPLSEQPEAIRRLAGWTPEWDEAHRAWRRQDADSLLAELEGTGSYKPTSPPRPPAGALRASMRGEELYDHLRNKMGAADWPVDADAATRAEFRRAAAERVSQHLMDNGIRGIRYLDASSRGGTDAPTRNYVVFDDKHVSVRRKYEQGGAVQAMATGGEVSGKKAAGGSAVATLRRMSDPAVNEAIRVINKSGSSPRDAVTLSKRLLGRQ